MACTATSILCAVTRSWKGLVSIPLPRGRRVALSEAGGLQNCMLASNAANTAFAFLQKKRKGKEGSEPWG